MENPPIKRFLHGGPVYLVGQRAFRMLAQRLIANYTSCDQYADAMDDRDVNFCLYDLGVVIGESLDEKSNLRFVPSNLMEFYFGI